MTGAEALAALEAKGQDGIEAYWREWNTRSIDGLPTGMPEAAE